MSVKDPIQPGDGDERHGTLGGYTNHDCRCDLCREANRLYQRRYCDELRARPVPAHVHGSENGYTNYGCRCERCTQAQTDAAWRRSA